MAIRGIAAEGCFPHPQSQHSNDFACIFFNLLRVLLVLWFSLTLRYIRLLYAVGARIGLEVIFLLELVALRFFCNFYGKWFALNYY